MSQRKNLSSSTSWHDRLIEVLRLRKNEHRHQGPRRALPNWGVSFSPPPMEPARKVIKYLKKEKNDHIQ